MEPTESELRPPAGSPASIAPSVIRGLALEHAEFVDRLAIAPTLLPDSERNLGEMLAFQARLTRQFFDLQRQLLERCAVLDAQVAAIDAAAVAGLDGDDRFLSSGLDVIDRDPSAFAADEVRQALAALATTVVTTPDDVASLAKVLDDADPNVARAALAGLETVTGMSFAAGRTPPEEIAAWRRWATARTH
mgnify:CR=1 FL=1